MLRSGAALEVLIAVRAAWQLLVSSAGLCCGDPEHSGSPGSAVEVYMFPGSISRPWLCRGSLGGSVQYQNME